MASQAATLEAQKAARSVFDVRAAGSTQSAQDAAEVAAVRACQSSSPWRVVSDALVAGMLADTIGRTALSSYPRAARALLLAAPIAVAARALIAERSFACYAPALAADTELGAAMRDAYARVSPPNDALLAAAREVAARRLVERDERRAALSALLRESTLAAVKGGKVDAGAGGARSGASGGIRSAPLPPPPAAEESGEWGAAEDAGSAEWGGNSSSAWGAADGSVGDGSAGNDDSAGDNDGGDRYSSSTGDGSSAPRFALSGAVQRSSVAPKGTAPPAGRAAMPGTGGAWGKDSSEVEQWVADEDLAGAGALTDVLGWGAGDDENSDSLAQPPTRGGDGSGGDGRGSDRRGGASGSRLRSERDEPPRSHRSGTSDERRSARREALRAEGGGGGGRLA